LIVVGPAGRPAAVICVSKRGTALMSSATVDLGRLRCPDCGSSYLDFRRTGRLGCPYDYVVFRAGILPLLDRLQRAKHHTGKRPRRGSSRSDQPNEIRSLWSRLREAVQAEQYDAAARLRDRIRGKEGKHGSQ
jgi:protein arginine kinase activator